jgi:hypothetical protein
MTRFVGLAAALAVLSTGCPGGASDDDDITPADDDDSAATDDDDVTADDDDDTTPSDDDDSPFYGNGFNADSLSNCPLGYNIGRSVSWRYRVTHTGAVEAVRVWLVAAGPGYFDGDGGHVLLQLQTDDGSAEHRPSGEVLASALVTDPMVERFRLFVLDGPASVTQGQLLHVVFSNPADDPTENWVSVQGLHVERDLPGVQPTIDDTDLACMIRWGTHYEWEHFTNVTPLFSMVYTDGFRDGQCYIDVRRDFEFMRAAGTNAIREVFTPRGSDRQAARVRLRLHRTEGEGALTVRLSEDGGALVEEVAVPAADVGEANAWIDAAFAQPITLRDGTAYSLELHAPAGTTYIAEPLQDGIYYDFECDSLYSDGHVQYSDGGDWTMIDDRTDFDLQFYFAAP